MHFFLLGLCFHLGLFLPIFVVYAMIVSNAYERALCYHVCIQWMRFLNLGGSCECFG